MKKLIIKIFVILSIILLLIFIQILLSKPIFDKIYNRSNFILPDSTKILILGNSHTKTSLDEDFIPYSLNFSNAGESLFHTYFELKLFLENKNNVRTVIINFTPDLFSNFNDAAIFETNYIPFLNNNEINILYDYSENIIRGHYIKKLLNFFNWGNRFKNICDIIVYCKILDSFILSNSKITKILQLFFESYRKMNLRNFEVFSDKYISYKSNLTESQTSIRIRKLFYKGNTLYGISDLSKKYLDSTINYCNKKNVKLIFINTPQHNDYYKQIPIIFKEFYNKQCYMLKEQGIPLVNRNNVFQFPDSCYGDGDHLNTYGMEQFSKMFNDSLTFYTNQ